MDTNRKSKMLTRQDSGTANSEQRRMPASWNQNRLTAKARDRVSHHSRSARRIVIAKSDVRSVQLWRTRIFWRTQLAARRHQRRNRGDSLSYSQTVRDELVGVNGG